MITAIILLTLIVLVVCSLLYGVQMAKKNGNYLKEDIIPDEFKDSQHTDENN